jgi:hypothetical protein
MELFGASNTRAQVWYVAHHLPWHAMCLARHGIEVNSMSEESLESLHFVIKSLNRRVAPFRSDEDPRAEVRAHAYTLCHVWHQLCNVTSKIPQTNLRTRYERKKLRQPDVDTVHQSTVERFIRIEENESEDSDAGNAIDDDEGGAGDAEDSDETVDEGAPEEQSELVVMSASAFHDARASTQGYFPTRRTSRKTYGAVNLIELGKHRLRRSGIEKEQRGMQRRSSASSHVRICDVTIAMRLAMLSSSSLMRFTLHCDTRRYVLDLPFAGILEIEVKTESVGKANIRLHTSVAHLAFSVRATGGKYVETDDREDDLYIILNSLGNTTTVIKAVTTHANATSILEISQSIGIPCRELAAGEEYSRELGIDDRQFRAMREKIQNTLRRQSQIPICAPSPDFRQFWKIARSRAKFNSEADAGECSEGTIGTIQARLPMLCMCGKFVAMNLHGILVDVKEKFCDDGVVFHYEAPGQPHYGCAETFTTDQQKKAVDLINNFLRGARVKYKN